MMERTHINVNEISRVRSQNMANSISEDADETRLLREAGIDPRSWLARRVSAGMINLGERLVRLGEGVAVEPDSSPCDDRLVTA